MFGFHKGLAPKNSDRLILQIIYTLKRTPFGPKKPFVNFGDVEKYPNKYFLIIQTGISSDLILLCCQKTLQF